MEPPPDQSRVLIAYFSRPGQNYVSGQLKHLAPGNTEVVAKLLVSLTGGSGFPIETAQPYPEGYHETAALAREELRTGARPALKYTLNDLALYDTILLGYPNWWGTMPMAVLTFLERHRWSGKTVAPFCTHEGSGLGRSEADLRRACPGATLTQGLALKGNAVAFLEADVRTWLAQVLGR